MRIRRARKKDIIQLVELIKELFLIEKDFEIDPDKQRNGLIMLLKSKSSIVIVADEENEVVGMITVQIVISTAQGGYSALIEDLVVKPGRRGEGIGTLLLNEALAWSKKRSCSRVQLLIDKDNLIAFKFYRKFGFITTNMEPLRKFIN